MRFLGHTVYRYLTPVKSNLSIFFPRIYHDLAPGRFPRAYTRTNRVYQLELLGHLSFHYDREKEREREGEKDGSRLAPPRHGRRTRRHTRSVCQAGDLSGHPMRILSRRVHNSTPEREIYALTKYTCMRRERKR